MKRLIVIFFCVTFNINGIAQNQNEILSKYLETRKNLDEFQSKMNFSLYINSVKNDPVENYDGIQATYKDVNYQKIGNTTFVSGKDFSVKLNSEEMAMLVGLSSDNINAGFQNFDVKRLGSFFKKIDLAEFPDRYKITFSEPRIEELIDFKKIEIILSKNKLNLLKQSFYYSSAVDLSVYNDNEDGNSMNLGMPILVVSYSDYRNKTSINKDLFEKDYYFTYSK